MDIISIAQQARPNVSGQTEFDCAQATALSTVVSQKRVLDRLDLALEDAGAALGPEHALGLEPGLGERAVADDRQVSLHCQLSAPFRHT